MHYQPHWPSNLASVKSEVTMSISDNTENTSLHQMVEIAGKHYQLTSVPSPIQPTAITSTAQQDSDGKSVRALSLAGG
jgi:hypothetical protein